MKTIGIDFAPRSTARTLRLAHPLSWLLILLACAAWIALGMRASTLVKEQEALAAALRQVSEQAQARQAEREANKRAAASVVISDTQAAAVNSAIAQLNLPWRDLFDAIESATPASIALLAIEPDAKKRVLKGTAEAKSSDEMIAYIEQLKRQEFFTGVLLVRHEVNQQDPNKPVRFQFEASWMEGRT